MITHSQQSWAIGQRVKVGFLTLTVKAAIPTPGDMMPDKYILVSDKGVEYEFMPHWGLNRL